MSGSATRPFRPSSPFRQRPLVLAWVLVGTLWVTGCASSRWAVARRQPNNPLAPVFQLDSRGGPRPTAPTLQMLRRKDLIQLVDDDPHSLLGRVQLVATAEPTADNVYAIAELAYVGAKRLELDGNAQAALDLYGTAVANAYFYLFDAMFEKGRNPYDPRFRLASEIYNRSLESALRYMRAQGQLRPGGVHTIETPRQVFDIAIASRGTWHEQNFCDLKFVSDFEVKELTNHYHTFGLGVPLIAAYRAPHGHSPADRFYPPGMSFPVTAFLRVVETTPAGEGNAGVRHRCVVEFHDPLKASSISVAGRPVPLETDLTTPLAHSLDNPAFKRANVPSRGLRDPEESSAVSGLYLLEPYDPKKIPVLMIHGFWSSLVTWMEMFNDLRGSPEIRERYQFWFYLYPTGPPFWFTAAHLRQQLADAREILDPHRQAVAMDQMILVGHSMGGLMAIMQTIDSEDRFWKLLTHRGPDELITSPEIRRNLERTLYFGPHPGVRRVITIATPHHGSNFANLTTRWLGRKLINLPEQLLAARVELLQANPGYFADDSLVHITTSVDSLAATSPVLQAVREAPHASWVTYHNVLGRLEGNRVLQALATDSDGVVEISSAHCDRAVSEVMVNAPHTKVHQQPRTILEVRRILLEHLDALEPTSRLAAPPSSISLMGRAREGKGSE